jgi:hypothetical protein
MRDEDHCPAARDLQEAAIYKFPMLAKNACNLRSTIMWMGHVPVWAPGVMITAWSALDLAILA